MNLEGLTLHILTNKLKEELLGGKIYKVFMPSYRVAAAACKTRTQYLRHCLLFQLRFTDAVTCR